MKNFEKRDIFENPHQKVTILVTKKMTEVGHMIVMTVIDVRRQIIGPDIPGIFPRQAITIIFENWKGEFEWKSMLVTKILFSDDETDGDFSSDSFHGPFLMAHALNSAAFRRQILWTFNKNCHFLPYFKLWRWFDFFSNFCKIWNKNWLPVISDRPLWPPTLTKERPF